MADYRGTKEYYLVYAELIRAAQYGGLTTYQEVARIMGLPLQGQHMGTEVGKMLGEISENEMAQGRPMLSAVVVGISGVPGAGFYWVARNAGRSVDDDERAFWEAEREAVYKAWRRQYR